MRQRLLLVTLTCLAAAGSLMVCFGQTAEEVDQNRRKLDKWRNDTKLYARLQQDARAFLALPAPQREQLLKLDHDLHAEDPATQKRLLGVLERYADWLERLPESQRQKIKEAPNRAERLRLVKDLREREWLDRLPWALRTKIEQAQGDARQALLEKVRADERQRRRDWQIALRHWDELMLAKKPLPMRPGEFGGEVDRFVKEYLWPLLSEGERKRLKEAENSKWPDYPRTLVELADKHPQALPGPFGPTRWEELPEEVQRKLTAKVAAKPKPAARLKKDLEAVTGRWPQFGRAVAQFAHKYNITLPHELWPTRPANLLPPARQFLEKQLGSVLEEKDKERLKRAEGSWPEFPQTIQELAARHGLRVPWHTLPDNVQKRWDKFRVRARSGDDAPPNLDGALWREFVQQEGNRHPVVGQGPNPGSL
jgi:hypothetical protein